MSHLIGTVSIPCIGLAIVFACDVGGHATLPSPSASDESVVAGTMPWQVVQAVPGFNAADDTGLHAIVRAAVDDAARRTGHDASTLQVISSGSVTWPDGSLGCPEPGVMYTMAPVPGYQVRIQAGITVLEYHASQSGYLVFCPRERATLEKTSRLGPVPLWGTGRALNRFRA